MDKDRKKILFLIHAMGSGGAEKILLDLINNLDNEKYNITLMTVLDSGPLLSQIPHNIEYKTIFKLPKKNTSKSIDQNPKDFNVIVKNSRSMAFLKQIYVLFWKMVPSSIIHRIFIKNNYDIEVSFLEGIPAKIISSSNNKKSKKYCWIHVDLMNEKKSFNFFRNKEHMQEVYSKFNKIVCVSKTVKESFINLIPQCSSKTIVLYNPIDSNKIESLAKKDCNISYENELINICTIGRLCNQKGYDRLIKVVYEFVNKYHDFNPFKIYIIGEGPDKNELIKMRDKLKLYKYIEFLGYKDNPYPYLKKSDLYLCSSRAEGYSTVATEATILSIPSVVTDCSGMNEIFENGKYGLIVDNSENGLLEGLKRIVYDKVYLQYKYALVERKDFFNINNLIKSVEDLFDHDED